MNPAVRSACRVLALVAVGAASLVTGACGGSDEKPAAAPATATTSYPIRHVFVSLRTGSTDPGKPPRAVAEARARAASLLQRLRAPGADVESIARAESEDPVTAPDGGFGGFVALWTKDAPEIVEAAAALAPGTWSDPIETAAGFHVVQRLSRDEGKALEARLVASVQGVLVRWQPMDASAPTTQTKSVAYAEAARTATDLRAGTADFATALARLQGIRPFWAVLRKNNTPGYEALAEKALAAAPDVWLDPVETTDGWAVVQRRKYGRATVRHFVVTHRASVAPASNPQRTVDIARAIAMDARERLRRDPSAWDEVVRTVTDEAASRETGGFIGEAATAAMQGQRLAPEIEEAVFALKPGEISEVVETRYGFEVFRRED